MGEFEIYKEGKPLPVQDRQRRPLMLLKALLAHGGQKVSSVVLAEELWPDADGDTAQQSLKTTLARLRKVVGPAAILLEDGLLSLRPGWWWLDVTAVERLIKTQQGEGSAEDTESLMALYRGPYLADEEAMPAAVIRRDEIHQLVMKRLLEQGEFLEQEERLERARDLYLKALEIDPSNEGFYRGLMRCYRSMGEYAAVVACYERCQRALSVASGSEPAEATQALLAR